MNPDLQRLQPYPFEKLRKLFGEVTPNAELNHITLGIGEPKHTPPQFVLDTLSNSLDRIGQYPSSAGLPELRQAIADWLTTRFELNSIGIDQIQPDNGTLGKAAIPRPSQPVAIATAS